MKIRRLALGMFFLVWTTAAFAQDGVVYVAGVSNLSLNGVQFTTELRVTNPTARNQSITVRFIPSFEAGTALPASSGAQQVSINAHKTIVFREGVVPAGMTGMLEILSEELVVSAHLVPSRGASTGLGASLPVVSSSSLRRAGNRQVLDGGERSGSRLTTFGIVNVSKSPGQCTVAIKSYGGTRLIETAVLEMKPLSQQYWRDVFKAVGVDSTRDARFEVNCTRESFPYAILMDSALPSATRIEPSERVGLSGLSVPTDAASCPPGATCFDRPGLFHTPTFSDPNYIANIRVPRGSYRQVKLTLEVRHGGWFSALPDGIHNLFWLRDESWESTLGYVNVRGPDRNIMSALTHAGYKPRSDVDRGPPRPSAGVKMQPGQTYTLEWIYNAEERRISTLLKSANGNVVSSIDGDAGLSRISSDGSFVLWVGNPDHRGDDAYEIPSIGWGYSDLHVEFVP